MSDVSDRAAQSLAVMARIGDHNRAREAGMAEVRWIAAHDVLRGVLVGLDVIDVALGRREFTQVRGIAQGLAFVVRGFLDEDERAGPA